MRFASIPTASTTLWRAGLLVLSGAVLTCSAAAELTNTPPSLSRQAAIESDKELSPEERAEQRKKAAEQRRQKEEARVKEDAAQAEAVYQEYEQAYLNGEMDKVKEMHLAIRSKQRHLSRDKQSAIRHMHRTAPTYRPKWWAGTKKQEKNSFKAEIWGKKFYANYVPSRELGLQAVYPEQKYNRRTNQWEVVDLTILVTWKPLMVDSTEAAEGKLAEIHGYKLGDIAEVIVWHELGHNYLTETISTQNNVELYQNYSDLYSTMHEYFADLAAIYHGTPRSRKVALHFRLDELDYYTRDSSHCRGAHGIGAILITDMLTHPEKWPSVHFPPAVPKQQIELNTIIYVYENLPAKWTAQEDIRLQKLAEEFVMKQGKRTFKAKGEIPLQNRLKFKLMAGEDSENQAKRDQWIKEKLNKLIQEGRADKLSEGKSYAPPKRDKQRRRELESNTPPRIDVPWNF